MPQTLGFLLFTIGAPLAVVNAVTLSGGIGSVLITAGLTAAFYGANALLNKPDIPKAEDGQITIRQPLASRKSGYGRQRIGGIYMLYEVTDNGVSVDVIALHHGLIDAVERWFLGDDEVTLDESNRVVHAEYYTDSNGNRVVAVELRYGADPETALGLPSALLPSIWTSAHRGDGIASLAITCAGVGENDFAKTYPNGLPTPTVVARLQRVYDPRTGTTAWTSNCALCLAHYLTAPHGAGYDWDAVIAPAIDFWIAAANVCDEQVPLKAGGTRARYEVHGTYSHDDDPSSVVKAFLAAMDGQLWQRQDNSIGVRAGKYQAPTVHIGSEHILGYQVQLGEAIERSVTEIKSTFTDQDSDFAPTEADTWIVAGAEAFLGRSLPMPMDLSWVGYHGQARRLAKREAIRQSAWVRGSIQTNLAGLDAIGERYITISIDELGPQFQNLIVEVTGMEVDLTSGATITWIAADPNIDEWDAASEEGTAPGAAEAYVPAATEPPDDVEAAAGSAGGATILTVTFTGDYDDKGLQIRIEWRLSDVGGGAPGAWQSATYPAADDGSGNYSYDVGPVASATDYDVRVAIVTQAGTLTAYSDETTVST